MSAFSKMDGVLEAKADQNAGTTLVKYDASKTNPDKLAAAFNDLKLPRFKAYKSGEAPPKPVFTYSGKEETLHGTLAVKSKDAGTDVICRLAAHRAGEENERFFNLLSGA